MGFFVKTDFVLADQVLGPVLAVVVKKWIPGPAVHNRLPGVPIFANIRGKGQHDLLGIIPLVMPVRQFRFHRFRNLFDHHISTVGQHNRTVIIVVLPVLCVALQRCPVMVRAAAGIAVPRDCQLFLQPPKRGQIDGGLVHGPLQRPLISDIAAQLRLNRENFLLITRHIQIGHGKLPDRKIPGSAVSLSGGLQGIEKLAVVIGSIRLFLQKLPPSPLFWRCKCSLNQPFKSRIIEFLRHHPAVLIHIDRFQVPLQVQFELELAQLLDSPASGHTKQSQKYREGIIVQGTVGVHVIVRGLRNILCDPDRLFDHPLQHLKRLVTGSSILVYHNLPRINQRPRHNIASCVECRHGGIGRHSGTCRFHQITVVRHRLSLIFNVRLPCHRPKPGIFRPAYPIPIRLIFHVNGVIAGGILAGGRNLPAALTVHRLPGLPVGIGSLHHRNRLSVRPHQYLPWRVCLIGRLIDRLNPDLDLISKRHRRALRYFPPLPGRCRGAAQGILPFFILHPIMSASFSALHCHFFADA